MTMLEGTYKSTDGYDYYDVALNLLTKEIVKIKNASCTAVASKMALQYFGLEYNLYNEKNVKIFYLSRESEINLNRIPKKYHKYFK